MTKKVLDRKGYIYHMGDLIKGLVIGILVGGFLVYLVMTGTIELSSILGGAASTAPVTP